MVKIASSVAHGYLVYNALWTSWDQQSVLIIKVSWNDSDFSGTTELCKSKVILDCNLDFGFHF